MDTYIVMLRRTGKHFGSPRELQPWQAEGMADRLRTILLYNTRTGEAIYHRER